MNESTSRRSFSRRTLLTAAVAGTVGSWALSQGEQGAAAAPNSAVLAASRIYCDFENGSFYVDGVQTTRNAAVSGNGVIGPTKANLIAANLPLAGGSVGSNRLPTAFEWHGASSPKTLLAVDNDGVRWSGTNPDSRYFGGIRTTARVAAPGESITVSFRARITNVQGHPHSVLRVSLLRTSDSKSTLLERAVTSSEQQLETVVVRLTAPTGGTDGYRLVFTGEAGSETRNQKATFEVRDVMVSETGRSTEPTVGPRYLVPPYSRDSYVGGDVKITPGTDRADYYLAARTREFGWVAQPVSVTPETRAISAREAFGADACLTILEFYLIERSKWRIGWMSTLSTARWLPLRYLEIDESAARSRPESPARLSRASGYVAASSVLAATSDATVVPSLDAPTENWAAAFDASRWSYLSFKTDTKTYIGETTSPPGVRSELHFNQPLAYGKDHWFSFWFRTNTIVQDHLYERKVVLFQTRYTKNASGDSSALSPELALEQLPMGRFAVSYRTDGGSPVLSGSATPNGITTRVIGPWSAANAAWQRIVLRVRYSNSGGGSLSVWLDGRELINGDAQVGYKRNAGPKVRFGSYKFSEFPSTVEFQNFEFGEQDLSSRVSAPLAI